MAVMRGNHHGNQICGHESLSPRVHDEPQEACRDKLKRSLSMVLVTRGLFLVIACT